MTAQIITTIGKTATKEQQSKLRDSNLELFRIITMLLIVAHHYVVNSGLMDLVYANPLAANSLFLFLFGAWGKTGINCFVFITGYFMCKSKITIKKFLKLILIVEFYKVVFYFIFLMSGYMSFGVKEFIKALLPITGVGKGFTSCYLLFYLTIPFLNVLLQNLNEKQHILLLCLSVFIYVILGTVPFIDVQMNYVTWFIVLYCCIYTYVS